MKLTLEKLYHSASQILHPFCTLCVATGKTIFRPLAFNFSKAQPASTFIYLHKCILYIFLLALIFIFFSLFLFLFYRLIILLFFYIYYNNHSKLISLLLINDYCLKIFPNGSFIKKKEIVFYKIQRKKD